MDPQTIILALSIVVAVQQASIIYERSAWRRERERMARLLAAKTASDAAVAEKILARPVREKPKPRGPSLYDDMYGTEQHKE